MKVNHRHELFVLVNTLANNLFGCFFNKSSSLIVDICNTFLEMILFDSFLFSGTFVFFYNSHVPYHKLNSALHNLLFTPPIHIQSIYQFPFNPGYNQKKDPTYIFCYVDIESLWMDPFPIKIPLLYVSFSDNKSMFSYL